MEVKLLLQSMIGKKAGSSAGADTGRRNAAMIFAVVLLMIIMQLIAMYYSNRIAKKNVPLVDAAMEIKLLTTTAHMKLEQFSSVDHVEVSLAEILAEIDSALWYARAILDGDESEEGVFIPISDAALREKIVHVIDELVLFGKNTEQFYNIHQVYLNAQQYQDNYDDIVETMKARSELLGTLNLHFRSILEDADHFETALQDEIRKETRVYLFFVMLMIAVFLLAAAFMVLTLRRYDQLNREQMARLEQANAAQVRQSWLRQGQFGLDEKMRGEKPVEELGREIITFLADYLGAGIGALYFNSGNDVYTLVASFAYKTRKNLANEFKLGKGLVGQAAYEKQSIMLTNVPDDYIAVSSGLGEKRPNVILVTPFIHNEVVTGVLELGTFGSFTEEQREFLEGVVPSIAVTLSAAMARKQLDEAFRKSQQLSRNLQAQQEELRSSNRELGEQTRRLQASEEELRAQQEELQAANEELQEKTYILEKKQSEVNDKNSALELAQLRLEKKAEELELSSKYKSEFLANMSHELRTPLNSLLILSQDLAGNRSGNLDPDQVESASIIYNSGNDLLKLINEILDLSKIEAGKMTLTIDKVPLQDSADWLRANFKHVAKERNLELNIVVEDGLAETIKTDRQRLDQILKNLMSNSLKFTAAGSVSVRYFQPEAGIDLSRSGMDSEGCLGISVTDTGIGIPKDKQLAIFEAFQQADGSTSRQYGGTGLGLSISRELAKLLGGELQLESVEGKGSTFTLYLPMVLDRRKKADLERRDKKAVPKTAAKPVEEQEPDEPIMGDQRQVPSIADDRDAIKEGDKIILIIEDDVKFAKILGKLCNERQFKFLHAGSGETGLELARQFKPNAIILDIKLPGIQGMSVLDILKSEQQTRHIPVHMMSVEEKSAEALKRGAIGFLTKPVGKVELDQAFAKIEEMVSGHLRRLLIVEDDPIQQKSIMKLIGDGDVTTIAVTSGAEALEKLQNDHVDCMILDLQLPDMTGFEVLQKLDGMKDVTVPPIIVYTGREITQAEEEELRKYASSIIIKGVRSPERLLDETALFLHRIIDKMPEHKQKMIATLHDADTMFEGKRVLVVDDDMRNVFAMTKILEDKGLKVFKAANGQKALDLLADETVDLVLMDIMMPIMDGYETMGRIRKMEGGRNLPIIALTAKAMKEDRMKCIEAGANDYLPKPVDVDRLLSLMRVWMYR